MTFCQIAIFSIKPKQEILLNFILVSLIIFRCYFFMSAGWLGFYLFFEASLVPILIIVLGWGYQVERLGASKFLIIYTIFGSMPFFFVIILFKKESLVWV
jgi:NADH-ubiquinone oxidoreductase chain 4